MSHIYWLVCGILLGSAYIVPSVWAGALIALCFTIFVSWLYEFCPRPSLWQTFLWGISYYAVSCHWFPRVVESFAGASWGVTGAFSALFFLVSALQFVFIELFRRGLTRSAFCGRYLLPLPLSWVAAEVLIPKLFPWSLGHTQIAVLPLSQCADLFGVPLISFLLLWWSALAVSIIRGWKSSTRNICILVVSMVIVFGYGELRLAQMIQAIENAPKISVALVQGNLDRERDMVLHKREANIKKYQKLTKEALGDDEVDLILWPESTVGYTYSIEEKQIPANSEFDPFPARSAALVFGGQAGNIISGADTAEYFITAHLLLPSGEITSVYKKQLLFPLAEVVPFREELPWLTELMQKAFKRRYLWRAGSDDQSPLTLPLRIRGEQTTLRLAVAICYEDMFPEILFQKDPNHKKPNQKDKEQAIDLLIGISNDNWFYNSIASREHHLMASWRAIEQRRFLLRATQTGVTAIVNPIGETIAKLPRFTEAVLRSNKVGILTEKSFFQMAGTLPIVIFSIFIACFSIVCAYR